MKKTVILFFALMLVSDIRAQQNSGEEPKYSETMLIKVIETVYEGVSSKAEAKMIIVTPDGRVQTKLLENASMLKDAGESLNEGLIRIRTELQKWQNNGWQVQAMSTASPMTYLLVTTIILTKN